MFKTLNQTGITHIILLFIAAIGFLVFVLVSSTFNFKDGLYNRLFPKPASHAAENNNIDVLVLKYFPVNDSRTELKREIVGTDVSNLNLAAIKSKVDTMTNGLVVNLKSATKYKGYKNSSADSYLDFNITDTKEYLEPVPVTFNVLDGDVNSGKWSPRSGFVGASLKVDAGDVKSFDKFTLHFWGADRPEKFHIDLSATGQFTGEQQRVITETNGLSGYSTVTAGSAMQSKTYNFSPTNARYIKLVVDEYRSDNPQGSAGSQINLYEIDPGFSIKGSLENSLNAAGYSNKFAFLNRENICDYVDNQGVKEVWMWMYHSDVVIPIESNMAMGTNAREYWNKGSYGDVSNSDRSNDLPACNHTYTVYEYNYGRELGEALHDHGHQLEALFNYIDNSDSKAKGAEGLFWKRFVGSDYTNDKILTPGCGWIHEPPNTDNVQAYIYNRTVPVLSDCENWKPDGTGVKTQISCNNWGCSGDSHTKFIVWWMQNIPGKDSCLIYNDKSLKNWWEFYADFDLAISSGRSLTTNSIQPCITPTPTTPAATATPTPVATSTPTPTPSPSATPIPSDDPYDPTGATPVTSSQPRLSAFELIKARKQSTQIPSTNNSTKPTSAETPTPLPEVSKPNVKRSGDTFGWFTDFISTINDGVAGGFTWVMEKAGLLKRS